jgi:hypothetical protein
LRRWRAAAWAVAFSVLFLLVPLAIYGPRIHAQAFQTVGQMGYGHSTWAELGRDYWRDPANQSINSLFHHLLTENPYTAPWWVGGPALANELTWLVSFLLLFWWSAAAVWGYLLPAAVAEVHRQTRERIGPELARHLPPALRPDRAAVPLFLAATLLMLLLPSIMWDHYAVQALPALMWVFGRRTTARRPVSFILALFIFTALAIPWPYDADPLRNGPAVLLMSLRLWPILALYGWLLSSRAGAINIRSTSTTVGSMSTAAGQD